MTQAKPMSALHRRMIDDMTLRNLSPATQRSFLHAVTKVSRHFGCPPDRLGLEDVRSFQVHLVSQRDILAGSEPDRLRVAVLLRRDAGPRRDSRVDRLCAHAAHAAFDPERHEVVRFLEAVPSLKTRVALTTAYAASLRASEVASLQVADIDSGRMVLQVQHGKGARDRTVMLSAALLAIREPATPSVLARRHGLRLKQRKDDMTTAENQCA